MNLYTVYLLKFYLQLGLPSQLFACQAHPVTVWSVGWRPPPQPGSAECGHTELKPSAEKPWCHIHAQGKDPAYHIWNKIQHKSNQNEYVRTVYIICATVTCTCEYWISEPPLRMWWNAPGRDRHVGSDHWGTNFPNCLSIPGCSLKCRQYIKESD